MGHTETRQFGDVGADVQTVGGYTEHHLRIGGMHQGEGFHCGFGIGEGVPGSCDADNIKKPFFHCFFKVVEGLSRCQD